VYYLTLPPRQESLSGLSFTLSQKTYPQPIEIRAMAWPEAQALVARGEADALIQITRPKNARKYTIFGHIGSNLNFRFFTATNRVGIAGISSLHGLRVGVEAGGLPRQFWKSTPIFR